MVPSMQHKIGAQRAGLGVGFLPKHKIINLLKSGELLALPVEIDLTPTPVYVAWKKVGQGRASRWFSDAINAKFKNLL